MTWTDLLSEALPEVARRAGRDTIGALGERLDALARQEGAAGEAPEVTYARLLPRLTREMARIEDEDVEMRDALAIARAQGDKRGALVEMLSRLGAPNLEADLAAIDRHLGIEAVEDRLLLRLHGARQEWEYLALALAARGRGALDDDAVVACRDAAARVLAGTRRPWPLRAAACRLAGRLSVEALPGAASVRQSLLALAHAVREDPWVQAAALQAWLALQSDHVAMDRVLRGVLLPHSSLRALLPETHAFLRARAAALAAEHGAWDLLVEALARPMDSEHVASTIARALARSPRLEDRATLEAFVRNQKADRLVRGCAVVESLGTPEEPGDPERWGPLVGAALHAEDAWLAELVVRAVLDRLPSCADAAVARRDRWRAALDHWAARDASPDLANAAWVLRTSLDVYADPPRRAALEAITAWTGKASEGDSAVFARGPVAALPPDALLEVLAVAAADGFDLSADPRSGDAHATTAPRRGYRLHLGTPPRFAWWRLAYEVRFPRPDKRQAWSFVTDRWPAGALVAMSTRLAEVTPTLVPGIRQGTPTRLDWGAALPLPSLLLSASRRGGIRVIGPRVAYDLRPRNAWRAWAAVQRGYVHLADLRLRMLGGTVDDPVRAFDEVVATTGLDVKRSAAAILPFVVLDDLAANLVAMDSNTVGQMAALSAGALALWIGRSAVRRASEDRWRKSIPLVIGGWGSRGKSGTERLKAAVFHGLGYTVLSKTTGCEAMVVSSIPGREPTEIFLYRPYDKATIFEQRNVVRLAHRMAPQVFLWECMALNPNYVEILQQDWVRDDFTTLTNTYPDHEDIQGPSGREVADVISQFIPHRGRVITSEQHMTPVLAQQARSRGSHLTLVRPEEWLLLPRDLLVRYPYNEHPRNIALVLRLMDQLGIARDVAMRAMADHVVPDLGVLKEYGPVDYDGRIASYVCGNSANERAGFVSNWLRMGFDEMPEDAGLKSFQITKVNNRADRLARQGVFAKIAALDASSDALLVIGTNVIPFHTQYLEALDKDLRDRMNDLAADRNKLLAEIGRRLRRRPWAPDDCRRIVREFAREVDPDAWIAAYYSDDPGPDALIKYRARELPFEGASRALVVEQWVRETGWLHRLAHTDAWSTATVIDGFLELLRSRARPLPNSALTGDQVLHQIVTTAPPGAEVRIMGSANIKGTGLDHVYRWLSVQRILGLARDLGANDPDTFKARVRALAAHANYGVADTRIAVKALRDVLATGRVKGVGLEEEVTRTVQRLEQHLAFKERSLQASVEASRFARIRTWFSQAVDFWDSIARRREADQLYDDLAARRIGQEDAAKVAKALVYRKK